ncbi:MAG: protein-L-isoaspartate O-methyltransferase [Gammaproteobacteria bacterium]|nr:protein-L-isoaspartate O-methyltransferase [Gammaproteobacteria bacterium]
MNTDFARQQMIEQQVRAWDVYSENVLNVLRDVPREQFVPAGYEALAFADTEIPLDHGQFMMTPTIEGRALQALDLEGSENVLEIGTGSAFLTACLATLASHVTSVDLFDGFLEDARRKLDLAERGNVDLQQMDATRELPDGKFDAIVVTGSMQSFDPRLTDALNPDGKLFVVVGDAPAMTAKIVTMTGNTEWQTESLFETELAPLINGALPPQFSF